MWWFKDIYRCIWSPAQIYLSLPPFIFQVKSVQCIHNVERSIDDVFVLFCFLIVSQCMCGCLSTICICDKQERHKSKRLHDCILSSNMYLFQHLIVFFVGFFSKEASFFQLVLKSVHTFFIGQWAIFQYFASTACFYLNASNENRKKNAMILV